MFATMSDRRRCRAWRLGLGSGLVILGFCLLFVQSPALAHQHEVGTLRELLDEHQQCEPADDRETISLLELFDYFRLLGYCDIPNSVQTYDLGLSTMGFYLVLDRFPPTTSTTILCEFYQYPSAAAAARFDPHQSRFAREVPDFPSVAARDDYIDSYCRVVRHHNTVLLINDEWYLDDLLPSARFRAKAFEHEFLRDYLAFSPRRYGELQDMVRQLAAARRLSVDEGVTSGEQVVDILGNVPAYPDPELATILLDQARRIREYADWFAPRLEAQARRFTGYSDIPELLAQRDYDQMARVGDVRTLDLLLDCAASDSYAADSPAIMSAAGDLLLRFDEEAIPPPRADDRAGVEAAVRQDNESGFLQRLQQQPGYTGAILGIGSMRIYRTVAVVTVIFYREHNGHRFASFGTTVYLRKDATGWQVNGLGGLVVS